MDELTCGEGGGAGGAETARHARRDMQAACQSGRREAVFDPRNGKELAETARKPRFLRFGQSFRIFQGPSAVERIAPVTNVLPGAICPSDRFVTGAICPRGEASLQPRPQSLPRTKKGNHGLFILRRAAMGHGQPLADSSLGCDFGRGSSRSEARAEAGAMCATLEPHASGGVVNSHIPPAPSMSPPAAVRQVRRGIHTG